jgi:hypothetical protein
VGEGEGVGPSVGATEGAGDGPTGGVGGDERFCGLGTADTAKSAAFTFVSVPLPSGPPGRRSMLDPAPGAGAATPSTNAFVASPHATASIGSPPIGRSTIAPPVAANPPLYVASAIAAWIPETFATSR